ncbi:MAG: queuosine salvage family protein [Candidatus Paceibacterota bacterium]|jgi:uncharacterized protein (DUF779 family)
MNIITQDPLNVLKSTKAVLEKAQFVSINQDNIQTIANQLLEDCEEKLNSMKKDFHLAGNLEDNLQLVFIEDVVNFCFWADKDKFKWQTEWPSGNIIFGGWYSLKSCFERALHNKVPILDANYLSSISSEDAKNFFKGVDDTQIPLLENRTDNLREAGKILLSEFNGKFVNVLEASEFDAIKLVQLIIKYFPSFRDISVIEGNEVFFLKRAQICACDVSYLLKKDKLSNFPLLTAFADYKLPQILRMFDIIEYSDDLAKKIDNMEEIPHDSREEIEIRSATIWAVELIRQKIGKMPTSNIDNLLWLMSQKIQDKAKPYHRTRTIYY